jgi:hypothetical protein
MSSIRIFLMVKAAKTRMANQSFKGVKKELHLWGEPISRIAGGLAGESFPYQRNRIGCTFTVVSIMGVTGNLQPGVERKFLKNVMDVTFDRVG